MNLEVEAYEGELKKLRKLETIINHEVLAEKLGYIYFISGYSGAVDKNGLPERLHVCPSYGVDWFQVYEKTDKTFGPEY